MGKRNDLDSEDSVDDDEESSSSDSKGKSSGTSGEDIDYKSKFEGSSRAVTKLVKERDLLREKLANHGSDAEIQLGEVRSSLQKAQDDLKAKNAELATAVADKAKFEREANSLKSQTEAAGLIAEKYPALLPDHLLGDLKTRGDFKDDESYTKYLDRQVSKYGVETESEDADDEEDDEEETPPPTKKQPVSQRVRGATPTAQFRVENARKGGKRPPEDIAQDLMTLNPNDPKYSVKYSALERELNEATS